jgi:hypothetical protein
VKNRFQNQLQIQFFKNQNTFEFQNQKARVDMNSFKEKQVYSHHLNNLEGCAGITHTNFSHREIDIIATDR